MNKLRANPRTELWAGRQVEQRLVFKEEGTFASYHKAIGWLNDNGYSYGSTSVNCPVGIMLGEYGIQKWHNLDKDDIKALHGVMISGDFRDGQVEILLFKFRNNK